MQVHISTHKYEVLSHNDPEASQCGSDDFLTFTQVLVAKQH